MMNTLANIKNQNEDFEVEVEVIPVVNSDDYLDDRRRKIIEGIASIDELIDETECKLNELNSEIDRLTNHADGVDYALAVASGVICGFIDALFEDDLSLDKANEFGNKKIDEFVVKVARKKGYKGEDIAGAIRYLEKYEIPADKVTNKFGGGKQHHLRDFSHHPTPVGLFFSLLTQFTKKVYGTDVRGVFTYADLQEKDMNLIGNNLPEKITFGVINWFFHIVSDMAGASSTVSGGSVGTGLPGPLVSLLKEISALPIFKKVNDKGYKEFSVWVSKLFNGTLLGKRDENGKLVEARKFDFRTELGIANQLKKQALPVIVNECIIRGFYFIRHLFKEIKDNSVDSFADLNKINWNNAVPFKNRTIVRMLTISTSVMTAIDIADAAIESGVKNGGFGPGFMKTMLVKVNFVGIGRCAIAIGTDVGMGIKRSKLRNERISTMNQYIFLLEGKLYYRQASMWIAAENTEKTLEEAYVQSLETTQKYIIAINDMKADFNKIGEYAETIEAHNKGLIEEINDILIWG